MLEQSYLGHWPEPDCGLGLLLEEGMGFYTEGFGGYIDAAYDYETPHQLGMIEEGEAVFLTVQSVVDAGDSRRLSMPSISIPLTETLYEMASLGERYGRCSRSLWRNSWEDFELFDTKLKGDSLALMEKLEYRWFRLGQGVHLRNRSSWQLAYRAGCSGSKSLKRGLAPRLSYVLPVTDRAQLGDFLERHRGFRKPNLETTVSEMADK